MPVFMFLFIHFNLIPVSQFRKLYFLKILKLRLILVFKRGLVKMEISEFHKNNGKKLMIKIKMLKCIYNSNTLQPIL